MGTLALVGCTSQPGQGEHTSPDATSSISATAFNLDTLPRIMEGACATPELAKIALRDCLLLPPVTEGASFTVIPNPEDGNQYSDTVSENRVIANYTRSTVDDRKLSPPYAAALKNILNDTVPAAALAEGTRIAVEQQTSKNNWSHYIDENKTIRMSVATDVQSTTIGEERAILTHESAHAVTAEWKWETEKDAAILQAYDAELYLGIEDVREKHGGEFIVLLKKFEQDAVRDYKNHVISKKVLNQMRKGAKTMKGLIKSTSGLGVALVKDGYGSTITELGTFRNVLYQNVSNKDIYKSGDPEKSRASQQTIEMDKYLAGYLAERFSYVTEYKNMDGMLVWNLGHPWDSTGEYIASLTANVELAPDKFLSSVKDIKGSRNKTVMALVLGIAKKYKKENPELYKNSNFPYIVQQLAG